MLWLLLPESNKNISATKEDNDNYNSNIKKDVNEESTIVLPNMQNDAVRKNLRAEAMMHGISSDRIIFADRVSKAEHILRYNELMILLMTVLLFMCVLQACSSRFVRRFFLLRSTFDRDGRSERGEYGCCF